MFLYCVILSIKNNIDRHFFFLTEGAAFTDTSSDDFLCNEEKGNMPREICCNDYESTYLYFINYFIKLFRMKFI